MMDVIEYIKYQYQITTKPIVILFAVEFVFCKVNVGPVPPIVV